MAWDGAKQAGFLLGALLAGDRELSSVSAALEPALFSKLQERCHGLSEAGSSRVHALRELAEQVRPPLVHAGALPVRARALVAALVPRERGRSYVREAPVARPDFEAEPRLLACLAELARRGATS